MTSQPHLENRIPIHQAHSRFFGESQSPDSGCARICGQEQQDTTEKNV